MPDRIPIHDFSPEDDLENRAVRCVALQVRSDYDFQEPHRHGYYEVFFFHKGGGTHTIDFTSHEIADNSVHLIRPGQVHLLHRALDSHGAVVCFSKETALQLASGHRLLQQNTAPVINHPGKEYQGSTAVLKLLEAELAGDNLHHEALMTCLDLLLLKSIASCAGQASPQEGKTPEVFTTFRLLAEEHYRSGKQPSWYAAQLHITEKRLNEACRKATGNPVSHYLRERLLLEAKRLLSHSGGSIKEIGYYLGFEDPAYFTRFFRKNAGITAGDFRSRYK